MVGRGSVNCSRNFLTVSRVTPVEALINLLPYPSAYCRIKLSYFKHINWYVGHEYPAFFDEKNNFYPEKITVVYLLLSESV